MGYLYRKDVEFLYICGFWWIVTCGNGVAAGVSV